MIECPICHVMNEDGAHFCAECGQRFSPAGPPQPPALGSVAPGLGNVPGGYGQPPGPPQNQSFSPHASAPPDSQWNQMPNSYNSGPPDQPNQPNQGGPPEQPKKRLHSPILGGGYEDEPEPEPEVKRGRPSLRGGGAEPGAGKPKHLRSPLLGGDDSEDDFDDEPPARGRGPQARSSKPAAKGGLRSPLLGGADEDDDYDYDEPQSRGGFPHRSRDVHDEEPHDRGSARGLRSPLLGGGSDDEDDSAFSTLRRTNKPSGSFPNDRRAKPDVWDPGSETGSGKPRRLRSSLLGGGASDDYDDFEDEEEEIADPKALRSPLLRAVTSAHEQVPPGKPQTQPHQPGPDPGYGNQADPGSPLFRQPLTPPQPTSPYADPAVQPQTQPLPQMAPPAAPPSQPQPAVQHASSPFARNSEPLPSELPPVPPRLSASGMPTTVKPSKPARYQSEDQDIPSRPSFDKFASDAPSEGGAGGAVNPAVAGLVALALLIKGWYFFSFPTMWKEATFVADQFAQIVVMVALIIVVMGVSKGRG